MKERDQRIEDKKTILEEKKKLSEENDSLRSQIAEVQGVANERHSRILEQESGLNLLREQTRILKEENEQLKKELEQLKKELEQLKKELKELTERVRRLELQVDTVTNKHNTLILRQIATSFQHKAAKYCGVGTLGRQYCITYKDLISSNKGDAVKINEVATLISGKGFDDIYINSFLQDLRIIGFSNAHPATTARRWQNTEL
jgi:seryl-tRNA synthetase